MHITVNDDSRSVATGMTVAELLAALELNPRHVAVEINGVLVPRERHAAHALADGDQLEVVTLVGGG